MFTFRAATLIALAGLVGCQVLSGLSSLDATDDTGGAGGATAVTGVSSSGQGGDDGCDDCDARCRSLLAEEGCQVNFVNVLCAAACAADRPESRACLCDSSSCGALRDCLDTGDLCLEAGACPPLGDEACVIGVSCEALRCEYDVKPGARCDRGAGADGVCSEDGYCVEPECMPGPNSSCPFTEYCDDYACVPTKEDGSACEASHECASTCCLEKKCADVAPGCVIGVTTSSSVGSTVSSVSSTSSSSSSSVSSTGSSSSTGQNAAAGHGGMLPY